MLQYLLRQLGEICFRSALTYFVKSSNSCIILGLPCPKYCHFDSTKLTTSSLRASCQCNEMSESQQSTIWGLSISFSIIAIAAVALRFSARRIKGQQLGADDWTVLVALV